MVTKTEPNSQSAGDSCSSTIEPLSGVHEQTHRSDSGPLAMERACDLLELLATHEDGLHFTAIQHATGITKPILSRLLKALIARDYIEHIDRLYRRSTGLLRLTRGLAPPPHSRRAVALAAEPIARDLFEEYEESVMVVHFDGHSLESLISLVAEGGLAAWNVGSRQTNLANGPWGWVVLHHQGILLQDIEIKKKSPAQTSKHESQLQDIYQQLDLDIGAVAVKQSHCWRIVHPLFCDNNRLVGVIGMFANPAALTTQQRQSIGQRSPND